MKPITTWKILLLIGAIIFFLSFITPSSIINEVFIYLGLVLCAVGFALIPVRSVEAHSWRISVYIVGILFLFSYFIPGMPNLSHVLQQLIIPVILASFVISLILRYQSRRK